MKNKPLLITTSIIILVLAFPAGYFYKKSCRLEDAHHRTLLQEHEKSGMDHFRGLDDQARKNSLELMSYLREEPPDTAKIHHKIDEIGEIQKNLQRMVIDTVLQKISAMPDEKRKEYLQEFESWLNQFRNNRW
jgi:hypothetical protein